MRMNNNNTNNNTLSILLSAVVIFLCAITTQAQSPPMTKDLDLVLHRASGRVFIYNSASPFAVGTWNETVMIGGRYRNGLTRIELIVEGGVHLNVFIRPASPTRAPELYIVPVTEAEDSSWAPLGGYGWVQELPNENYRFVVKVALVRGEGGNYYEP